MQLFNPGDRVTSTFDGLCLGIPGTILIRSLISQGNCPRYVVEFDNGERLALWEAHLKHI